jgi:hypothetical protein
VNRHEDCVRVAVRVVASFKVVEDGREPIGQFLEADAIQVERLTGGFLQLASGFGDLGDEGLERGGAESSTGPRFADVERP